MPVPLPVELLSAIIEYFGGDRAALEQLALVSRTWTVQSRRLLLRGVRLRQTAEHDAVDAFSRFLDAPLGSRSRAHIRHVTVFGEPPEDNQYEEPTISLRALGEMLQKVPRVADIEVRLVKYAGFARDEPDPPIVEHVQWLQISRGTTWTAHDFKNTMDILHMFPNLKTFRTYGGLSYLEDTTGGYKLLYELPDDNRPFPAGLELATVIHKIYGPTDPLLRYLLRDFSLRSLTTLAIWHLDYLEIDSLKDMIANISGTLKRLELNLSDARFWRYQPGYGTTTPPKKKWPELGLVQCKVLDTLCLFVPRDDDPEAPHPGTDVYPMWRSAESICSALPSSLRRLHLGIEVLKEPEWQEEVLHDVRWHKLARNLGRLPNLECVWCYREDRWNEDVITPLEDWIQDIIKEGMQSLFGRGLLQFHVPRRASLNHIP